ncbi:MAG: hypothetical protein IMZ66_07065, partial [Planctomycetes bacterium]|nr:hypothetical protein [Planctomycetota bacterium]
AGAVFAWAAAAAGLVAAAGPVRAERIVTRGGTTFTGQIIKDEGGKIVVKTVSGTIPVARNDIERIDKDAPDAKDTVPEVVPVEVKPEKAAEALAQALRAAAFGRGHLERDKRLARRGPCEPRPSAAGISSATNALRGAGVASRGLRPRVSRARSLAIRGTGYPRAKPAAREAHRARCHAAQTTWASALRAEAFRTVKGIRLGDQDIRAYGEALPAAVRWKGEKLVEEAKGLVAGGRMYAVPQRLLRTAQAAAARLEEADQYTPGVGSGRRHEILKTLADDLLDGVRKAIAFCTEERQGLDQSRWQSLSNKEVVKGWAGRIMHYISVRNQADSALENLQTMSEKIGDRGLYDAKAYEGLRAQMEELKFYPRGAGTKHRVRIKPYRTAP